MQAPDPAKAPPDLGLHHLPPPGAARPASLADGTVAVVPTIACASEDQGHHATVVLAVLRPQKCL
jgi:hypothetical protein